MAVSMHKRLPRSEANAKASKSRISADDRPVRKAMVVGHARDAAERDADRFAARLVADLSLRPTVLRRASDHAGPDRLGGTQVDADVERRIRTAGGGARVPGKIRRAVEARSGRDLKSVRVHTGTEADTLSRALDATAFTVGSDVFLGREAGRPDSATGTQVLAHELGHVLQSPGPVKVRRLFGKPKKGAPVVGASGNVEKANGLSKQDKAEQKAGYARGAAQRKKLQADIAPLDSALRKLLKNKKARTNEDYSAAFLLRDKAQRMLDLMPGPDARGAQKVLGVAYAEERKRLRHIVGEAQMIYDEHLVAMTKKKAGNIYMEAGKNAAGTDAGGATIAAGPKGFTKLTGTAKRAGFLDVDPEKSPESAARRAKGAELGLTPAEFAAIITFTAEDYKYINPATGNNEEWMKRSNVDLIDKPDLDADEQEKLAESFKQVSAAEQMKARKKDLSTRKEEGALHAGMIMQGMAKLPAWKGTLYRGEVLTRADFDAKFATVVPDMKFRARDKSMKRTTVSSASTDLSVARGFLYIAGQKVPAPKVNLVYQMDVTNGRDIQQLSASAGEKEIALMAGSTFSITSVTAETSTFGIMSVLVKCKQTK